MTTSLPQRMHKDLQRTAVPGLRRPYVRGGIRADAWAGGIGFELARCLK